MKVVYRKISCSYPNLLEGYAFDHDGYTVNLYVRYDGFWCYIIKEIGKNIVVYNKGAIFVRRRYAKIDALDWLSLDKKRANDAVVS